MDPRTEASLAYIDLALGALDVQLAKLDGLNSDLADETQNLSKLKADLGTIYVNDGRTKPSERIKRANETSAAISLGTSDLAAIQARIRDQETIVIQTAEPARRAIIGAFGLLMQHMKLVGEEFIKSNFEHQQLGASIQTLAAAYKPVRDVAALEYFITRFAHSMPERIEQCRGWARNFASLRPFIEAAGENFVLDLAPEEPMQVTELQPIAA